MANIAYRGSECPGSPHPGPFAWRSAGLAATPAETDGLRLPGSCAGTAAPGLPHVPSPRQAHESTLRRVRHAPYTYIMNPLSLSPPPKPVLRRPRFVRPALRALPLTLAGRG